MNPFFGTLPGWITAFSSTGALLFLGLLLRWQLGNRRLGIEDKKTTADARKVDAETGDIAMGSLQRQIERLDKRVELLETEVEECHRDRDLAMAAARYLHDRLSAVAPNDAAIERLKPYLDQSPAFGVPTRMNRSLDDLKNVAGTGQDGS